MTIQLRPFTVVNPNTRVSLSQDGRLILSVETAGDGVNHGKVFRWRDGAYFERVMEIPTLEGATGCAFRHSLFGSSEVAVICGGEIRRFGLRLDCAELPGLRVPGASALAYSAQGDAELFLVGTAGGELLAYRIDGPELKAVWRRPVFDRPIQKLVSMAARESVTVLTENGQWLSVLLTDFSLVEPDVDAVSAFAYSQDFSSIAIAQPSGRLVVGTGEDDSAWVMEGFPAVSALCFASPTELGVAYGNPGQVEIIHLDRLTECEGSQEPELSPEDADYEIFVNGSLMPVYSQHLTRSNRPNHREQGLLPWDAQRVWGLGSDAGQLAIVYSR